MQLKNKISLEQEKQIIKSYRDDGLKSPEIEKRLNIPRNTVLDILKRNNIKIDSGILSNKKQLELIDKYKTDRLNTKELSEIYNISYRIVCRVLRNNGVTLVRQRQRKYTLNQNYFRKIDTENKAYFLGFLFADGCHSEEGSTIVISLQMRDKSILEKFAKELETDKPIRIRAPRNSSEQWVAIFDFHSKFMADDLLKLGLVPRKSLIVNFPSLELLPEHLQKHFIRGYFCGNGCIGIYQTKNTIHRAITICSSVQFCESLKEIINKNLNLNPSIRLRKSERLNLNMGTLTLCGKKIFKFLDWIYEDSHFHIQRKYEKYITEKAILEEKEATKLPITPILV